MFYENIDLLPPGDSSDSSPDNYYPTEGIMSVIVSIFISNKLVWVEVENEY